MMLDLLATLVPGRDRLLAHGEALFRARDPALGLVIVRRGVLELRRLSPEGCLSVLHRAGPGRGGGRHRHGHRHGVAAIPVEDITDPWLRQAITNEANRRWGLRDGGHGHGR